MKHSSILGITLLFFSTLLWLGCDKEGVCECTAVYSNALPDTTWEQIRPAESDDCTWLEGRHYYGNYHADITCRKVR